MHGRQKILAIPPLKYFLRNNTFSKYNSSVIISLNSHVLELLPPHAFFTQKHA